MDRGGHLLWWGVLDEVDALFDVALEALGASLEELLLLVSDAVEHVGDFFGTIGLYIVLARLVYMPRYMRMDIAYPESHKSREEFDTSCLGDLVTTSNAGQVNESRLDDTSLTSESLDNSLGESNGMVRSDGHCFLVKRLNSNL